jgi:O-antigen/teichoic acid export membrane protein
VPGFSIPHVIIAYIVITIGVTAYQAWALGTDAVTASWQSKGRDIRPYLRPRASALVFVAIITVAFADIVTMMAGLCLPTSDVAVVGVAVRLAALAGFVTQSSQQFVIRDLTDAMTKGDEAGVDALLLRVNLIVCAVMGATIVGALVLGSPVLGMFGQAYTAGFWPLIIFLSGQAFRAAGGMNAYLLSLKGYQSRTAQSCALAMLVLISGIVILAPRWGITGVAVAVVLTDAVWAFHLSYLAQRCIGRRADIVAVALHRLTPAA